MYAGPAAICVDPDFRVIHLQGWVDVADSGYATGNVGDQMRLRIKNRQIVALQLEHNGGQISVREHTGDQAPGHCRNSVPG